MIKNRISVIIPVYNAEKTIVKCIESIVNQTYKNIDIIIIDDGSKDNSYVICNKIAENYNNIKVYTQENSGVSKARNEGLKLADGEYVTFVDADDYLEQDDAYEKMMAFYKENFDLVMCGTTQSKKIEKDMFFIKNDNLNYLFDKNYYRGFVANKIYKSIIIQKNNILFDEEIAILEDLLFNYQYMLNCNKTVYLKEKLYHYSINVDSALHKKIDKKYFSVTNACEKLLELANDNGQDKNIIVKSYFKILTDLIYKNSVLEKKFDITEIKKKRIRLFKQIKNKSFDEYIYLLFPKFIGRLKVIVKKGRL